jgi:outer membrane protein assembly factor BamB
MAVKKTAAKKTAAKKTTAKKTTAKKTAAKEAPHGVLRGLPILWAHKLGGQAIGLHVDEREAWAGSESGDVVACDHDGAVLRRWRLPAGVDALVADEAWRYAGCRDGTVYDLTGETPRAAYVVDPSACVQAVAVFRGNLCAADSAGSCTVVDPEQSELWRHRQTPRGSSGWMVCAEEGGVYLGNSAGVHRFDWSGKRRWFRKTAWVGYGWAAGDRVHAIVDAVSSSVAVVAIDKARGKLLWRAPCSSDAPTYRPRNNAAACAASATGDRVFGGTRDTLFCFDADGALQWETPTRCGATCSMALLGDRLFVVTQTGVFACLDVSAEAVARAKARPGPRAAVRALPPIAVTDRALREAASAAGGVELECVAEGEQLRVYVRSPGYRADWHCQFPRDIREPGARYVVEAVREATQGGFYRAIGEIRRLRG